MAIRKLFGVSTKVDEKGLARLQHDFAPFLLEGETILQGYSFVRDRFVFTEKRLIIHNKKGITGKRQEFFNVPYSSITCFSAQSAGHLDLSGEIKLWVKDYHVAQGTGYIALTVSGADSSKEIVSLLSKVMLADEKDVMKIK